MRHIAYEDLLENILPEIDSDEGTTASTYTEIDFDALRVTHDTINGIVTVAPRIKWQNEADGFYITFEDDGTGTTSCTCVAS